MVNAAPFPLIGIDDQDASGLDARMAEVQEFETFVRNYQNMVFSVAARIVGNPIDAQDISQEVFIKAYAPFDELNQSGTVGGWLKTVSTNLSINHVNRYRARWRIFSEEETEIEIVRKDLPFIRSSAVGFVLAVLVLVPLFNPGAVVINFLARSPFLHFLGEMLEVAGTILTNLHVFQLPLGWLVALVAGLSYLTCIFAASTVRHLATAKRS